jgi:hypothetical protein
MGIYIHWLQQLEEKGETIYKLSDFEIKYLTNFVATNTGRGTIFANNILCYLYNICIEIEESPVYAPPKVHIEGEKKSYQIDNKVLLDNIQVIPNPTIGELRVKSVELIVEKISVLDIVGRVVLTKNIITPLSIQNVDISHLNNGIYFIKVTTDKGEIAKKVVKM